MNESKTKNFKLFLIVVGAIALLTMLIVSVNPSLNAKAGLYDISRAIFYLANALMGVASLIDVIQFKKEKIAEEITQFKFNSIDLLFISGVIWKTLFFTTIAINCYVKTTDIDALAFTFLLAMLLCYAACWYKMKPLFMGED